MKTPSIDWPRRVVPLTGSEDLLKQNPVSDAFPQEERIPVSLISDHTISNLSFTNVGTGIGTFDFNIAGDIRFRSVAAGSNKVNVNLVSKTIVLDVDSANIASELSITDLSDVSLPTATNQYLMWDGGGYVFNSSPFSFSVTANNPPSSLSIDNGDVLSIISSSPIVSTIASSSVVLSFNGGLNVLNDVNIVGSVPNGYVLGYNSSTSQWEPLAPSAASSYSFSMKGDGVDIFSVPSLSTVSLLGNSSTITTAVTGTNEISIDWSANLSDLGNVSSQTPLNDQALVYNSGTSQWEPKTISGGSNIFSNGLTAFGSSVKLGGLLTNNTMIDGDNHDFNFILNDLLYYRHNTKNGTYVSYINDNVLAGHINHEASNLSTGHVHSLSLIPAFEEATLTSQISGTTEVFKVKTSTTEAGLYFENNSVKQTGFFVEQDSITIMDGVNVPSAGDVLTYMSDGTSQFQPAGASSYTFTNGLTATGTTVKLGGTLTEDVNIDGDSHTYGITYNNLSDFFVRTTKIDNLSVGHQFDFFSNLSTGNYAGQSGLYAFNLDAASLQRLWMDSGDETIHIASVNGTYDNVFKVETTMNNAGIYYTISGVTQAGFQVQSDKIVVVDGVNSAPTVDSVLSYASDGSALWVAPKERISLCEFDATSNITVGNGSKFYTVPTEMDGWTITGFTSSVYTLGSGLSTRVELLINGVAASGSSLTMGGKFDSKTGLSQVVNEGDTISLNILNTKPTPDQGLSVTITLTK